MKSLMCMPSRPAMTNEHNVPASATCEYLDICLCASIHTRFKEAETLPCLNYRQTRISNHASSGKHAALQAAFLYHDVVSSRNRGMQKSPRCKIHVQALEGRSCCWLPEMSHAAAFRLAAAFTGGPGPDYHKHQAQEACIALS